MWCLPTSPPCPADTAGGEPHPGHALSQRIWVRGLWGTPLSVHQGRWQQEPETYPDVRAGSWGKTSLLLGDKVPFLEQEASDMDPEDGRVVISISTTLSGEPDVCEVRRSPKYFSPMYSVRS